VGLLFLKRLWHELFKGLLGPILITLGISVSGCNSLSSTLFYPHTGHYQTPESLNVRYETIELKSNGDVLNNWLLFPEPSTPHKGTILYLHGNGENISTHFNSVAWLTLHGYKVFLLDYRGYGKSTGTSTLESAFYDVHQAHLWLSQQGEQPLFLLGQSMGGALAITYQSLVDRDYFHTDEIQTLTPALMPFKALITESAPASWPQVAREAMSRQWLTWIIVPATFLLPSQWDPEDHIDKLDKTAILLMHSKKDRIVGFQHMEQLERKAREKNLDVQTYETNGNHTQGFAYEQARQTLLKFLDEQTAN
jgi:alpha-beta hydrolase superfamily lysophospholipase